MLKKLLVALLASVFAIGVYAQAPKSGTTKAEPKGQTGTTTQRAEPAKGEKKKAKAKAKKDAAASPKADAKKSAKAK